MTKYWFKPKTYGYGMTPISWEGWLVTLLLVGSILLTAYAHQMFLSPGPREIVGFLIDAGVLTSLFLIFCKDKTDGKLAWRWGKKKWFGL